MWGARGSFLPTVAMVVAVVTPILFCAKATEILKNVKNSKIGFFYWIIYNFISKYIVKYIG